MAVELADMVAIPPTDALVCAGWMTINNVVRAFFCPLIGHFMRDIENTYLM